MFENKVKFYGKCDSAGPLELKKAEKVLNTLNSGFVCNNLNDALELINIEKYFIHDLQLAEWGESIYSNYKKTQK